MAASDFEILDDRFRALIRSSANLEQLHTGSVWAEGPAYFPAGRFLLWSDIPNDRLLRWDEPSGAVSVFRSGGGQYTNGNVVDRAGRLVSCEHGTRCVTRTGHDGSVAVLADRYRGKRLNSPNDVVVKSDGSVWFTDPSYGIDSDYEGHRAAPELDGCFVFRVDPRSHECVCVADDFARPNGLAFSPDESRLYIVDSGVTPGIIRVFDVAGDDRISGGRLFATCAAGRFDGFRVDAAGRVWTSTWDGVHCYEPDGTLIGKIRVPEYVSNVVFGGPKRNRLFICATTSLYSMRLTVNGAKTF